MWFDTRLVLLTAGAASGFTELNAFDNALRQARIADFNLVRVTSILPANVPTRRIDADGPPIAGRGILTPTVYDAFVSNKPGATIASAVGLARPEDLSSEGVIFVCSAEGSESAVSSRIEEMLKEGMAARGHKAYSRCIVSSSTTVTGSWSAVVAAALFCDADIELLFAKTRLIDCFDTE